MDLILISNAGAKFKIPMDVGISQSEFIRDSCALQNFNENIYSDSESEESESDCEEKEDLVIFLPAEDEILAKIVEFMSYHYKNPIEKFEKPIITNDFTKICKDKFDIEMVNCSINILHKLLKISSHLRLNNCLNLVACKIATMLKDRSQDDVNTLLNITTPFTQEDEDYINSANPWLAEL